MATCLFFKGMTMKYFDIIEKNKDEMISTLKDLIRIDSKKDRPFKTKEEEIYPFGKGVHEAFIYTLNKAKEMGFETENVDNYGGHIDMGGYILDDEGDIERAGLYTMGILAHLDVVPEGDGWSVDPFGGIEKDGYIYGRGTQDDKGPLVAVLYAMKALDESGFVPAKRVRLILGLDEETGWSGMDYYFKYQSMPDFGFTPDGDFPVINGEKGILTFQLAKKIGKCQIKGLELRSVNGGTAPNMVPGAARAILRAEDKEVYQFIKDRAAEYRSETGHRVNVKGVGKSLEVAALGKAAHAAHPEAGQNAISILVDFLGKLNFVNEDCNEVIDFYNKYFAMETDGRSLGISFSDEESGNLTLNVGEISMDDESLTMTINVRYPVTLDHEKIYESIEGILARYDFGLIKGRHQEPIYMDPNSPLIKTFMEVYQDNTKDYDAEPKVIGGGSYARAIKNGVAFGGLFPGDEDLMHQKDERISVETMVKMCKIYADAIYRLSKDEEVDI